MEVRSAWYDVVRCVLSFLLLALFLSRAVCRSHRHWVRPPSATQHVAGTVSQRRCNANFPTLVMETVEGGTAEECWTFASRGHRNEDHRSWMVTV